MPQNIEGQSGLSQHYGCPDCGQPIGSYHVPDCPRARGISGPVMVTSVSPGPMELLADLRRAGWRVACHNDYAFKGKLFTFWLFTHETGVFVKGEGATDLDAMREAVSDIQRRGLNFGNIIQALSDANNVGTTKTPNPGE